MKKPFIFLVLSIISLCLGLVMAEEADAAFEPEIIKCGDFDYVVLNDGTVEIVSCSSDEVSLTIPEELNGHRVSSLGDNALSWRSSLKTVVIPDEIVHVGLNPFVGCKKLNIIVSPNHPYLALIDGVLFSKPDKRLIYYPCQSGAKSYAIPDGVAAIGGSAFAYCYDLSSIIIPDSVNTIEEYAFSFCDSLTSAIIPENVSSLGDKAFLRCSSLNSVELPDSITRIGDNPFAYCYRLKDINVSPNHQYLKTINGVLYSIPDNRLVCYPCTIKAESYVIPDGVNTIGAYAFYWCDSLTSVTIPESVTNIGTCAFCGCGLLKTINIPENVSQIGMYAFSDCKSLESITIPDSVISIEKYAFDDCPLLRVIASYDSYAKQYCIDNNIFCVIPNSDDDWLNN